MRLWRQKQVSKTGVSNYINSKLRDVIIYPWFRYLLLVPKSSYIWGPKFGHLSVVHIFLSWDEFVIPCVFPADLSTLSTTIIRTGTLDISRPYGAQYAQRSTITMGKLQPDFAHANDTPYLSLTGELSGYGVYFVSFSKKMTAIYQGFAL